MKRIEAWALFDKAGNVLRLTVLGRHGDNIGADDPLVFSQGHIRLVLYDAREKALVRAAQRSAHSGKGVDRLRLLVAVKVYEKAKINRSRRKK